MRAAAGRAERGAQPRVRRQREGSGGCSVAVVLFRHGAILQDSLKMESARLACTHSRIKLDCDALRQVPACLLRMKLQCRSKRRPKKFTPCRICDASKLTTKKRGVSLGRARDNARCRRQRSTGLRSFWTPGLLLDANTSEAAEFEALIARFQLTDFLICFATVRG